MKTPITAAMLLIMFTQPLYAVRSRGIENHGLNQWRESLNEQLPKSLRTSSSYFEFSTKVKHKECLKRLKVGYERGQFIPDNRHRKGLKIFSVNRACLTAQDKKDIEGHTFNKSSLLSSKFQKAYIREVVKIKLPFRLKRLKNKVKLYKNNFFRTSETIGVNIKASHYDASMSFFQEATLHYIGNPEFGKSSPGAYLHVQENLFTKKGKVTEYYKQSDDLEKLAKEDKYNNTGKIKVLNSGNETLWARYQMIKNAKKSIYMSYFAWHDDVYGLALKGLLLQKLKENPKLDVLLLLDGKGAFKGHHSDSTKQLIKHGAKVKVYNPALLNKSWIARTLKIGFVDGIVAMNHDKILLVDEKMFTTGGRNVGASYFVGPDEGEEGKHVYKDTDIIVKFDKAPISVIKAIFVEYYSLFSSNVWEEKNIGTDGLDMLDALKAVEDRMFNKKLSQETLDKYPILEKHKSIFGYKEWKLKLSEKSLPVTGYDNTSRLNRTFDLTDKFLDMIDNAEDEIVIQNPYVVLTDRTLSHFIEAGKRGVKITIVTGSHVSSDSSLTIRHLNKNWRNILEQVPNIRLYGYIGEEKSHSKTFVFDRKTTMIGSYNLDVISEKLNSEFAVFVEDEETALQEIDTIREVIKGSYEYHLEGDLGPESIPGKISEEKLKKVNGLFNKIITTISTPWL